MSDLSRRLLPSTAALAAFDAVARRGSFTAAARELALTQSAVSHQVAGLEAQLGVALLERGPKGARLTAQGEAYARAVSGALAVIRDASLAAMTDRHDPVLTLAILPTFGTRWLMPRLPRFVARHPEITLNFVTRIGRVDFEREGIDAAIHVGAPDWPGTIFTPLMGETVVPVASPAFLAREGVRGPADLARLPLLHLASRPGGWEQWFRAAGLVPPPGPGLTFEQFAMVAQAAGAGIGVALLPEFLVGAELEAGQLAVAVDVRVETEGGYHLATPPARAELPKVRAFADWLVAEARGAGRDAPGRDERDQPDG
jgi:DNA-binding transcriptional LysR family regulator